MQAGGYYSGGGAAPLGNESGKAFGHAAAVRLAAGEQGKGIGRLPHRHAAAIQHPAAAAARRGNDQPRQSSQSARSRRPLDSATPHFALPPGSVVRLRESAGDWLRIRAGRDEGWVRRSAAQAVLPWQDPGLR